MLKKDILFVVDEQMYGGISTVLTTMLKQLDYNKYNIDVLILHNRGNALTSGDLPKEVNIIYGTSFFKAIDYTISAAIKTMNISLIWHKIKIVLGLKNGTIKSSIEKERKKILKKKYDVEIAFKDGFCVVFTAYGDSTKKVSWLHTSYDVYDCTGRYRKLFKDAYSKIHNVVAITEDVSKTFNKIYNKEKETQVIENLVIPEEIIKKSKEEEITFEKEKINLISVGRLSQVKGYPRLIEQFIKLKNEGLLENVVFHLIGDGEEKQILEKMIKDNNLEANIKLYGYKENPYPYIAKSDMLILSSYYEGLGLVLVEANILKVPCLATRFANVDKTLSNGKYGMIVENTEEGIYNGLKEILTNEENLIQKYKNNLKEYKYNKNEEILKNINTLFEEK